MINIRREKGNNEMIYLREVRLVGELNREYDVMGMSGNKYTLWIHKSPACTCPDFNGRGGRCKHIYYVLDKILHVNEAIIDKDEFSEDDLRVIFDKPIQKPSDTKMVSDNHISVNTSDERSYFEMMYDKLVGWVGCIDVKDD
jgi:hypothetical protein